MKAIHSIIFISALSVGCKTSQVASSGSSASNYTEDLSVWRPKFIDPKTDTFSVKKSPPAKSTRTVEAKFTVNKKLDAVLDSINQFYLRRNYIEGFTIQVYTGKREDAISTRRQLSQLVPEVSAEVQFTEPVFRVKAGKYYNRIDAQHHFNLIQKYFPAAIIVPERIPKI